MNLPPLKQIVILDPASPTPLFRQIYYALRDGILAGELRPGSRLPASRLLALELGVARLTVQTAYEHLVAEGYAQGRHGSGTYVAIQPPAQPAAVQPLGSGQPPTAPARRVARRVAALPPLPEPTPGIDTAISPAFQPHLPAVDAFPTQLWGRLWGRRWRTSAGPLLAPSAQAASAPLRTALADQLNAGRGLRCTAEQIIIVTGGQQALELVAHVLLDPGDKAWVEDPGSSGLRAVLISAGVHLCPVPVDGDGLAVAAGIARHGDARLAVVRPAHQWPTGVTMTLPRRLALLEWAYQAGAWVVEDDSGGAFAYTTHATTPLQALDQGARVLQIGSLSQLLFPALRLGYLIAPPDLVEPLLWVQHLTSRPPPAVDQAVLADFITGGHFAQHLRRLTDLYQERQSTLLAACQRELGEWLNVQPATAGFHLTGWLAPGLDDRAVAAQAAALGITVTPISPQRLIPGGPQGLALGYGGVRPELIGPAVQRLATVLEERR